MKTKKTMKGQGIPNNRRKKGKKVDSNIDSATDNQTLINKNNYMTGITTYLSILTLNVNDYILPSKDTHWQTGLKRMFQ
jgi:hypothetical protein